ncbi:hypothetical protein [Bacteroides heparinolyticus]
MIDFMNCYVTFFNAHWIWLGILWVLLIILARTKMEMRWLDIYIPGTAFFLWAIFGLFLWIL